MHLRKYLSEQVCLSGRIIFWINVLGPRSEIMRAEMFESDQIWKQSICGSEYSNRDRETFHSTHTMES